MQLKKPETNQLLALIHQAPKYYHCWKYIGWETFWCTRKCINSTEIEEDNRKCCLPSNFCRQWVSFFNACREKEDTWVLIISAVVDLLLIRSPVKFRIGEEATTTFKISIHFIILMLSHFCGNSESNALQLWRLQYWWNRFVLQLW